MTDFTPISAREDMLLFPSGDSGGQAGWVGRGPLAAGVPDSQLVHEDPCGLLGRECQLAATGAGKEDEAAWPRTSPINIQLILSARRRAALSKWKALG